MHCKCDRGMMPLAEDRVLTNYRVWWWCPNCGRVAIYESYYTHEKGIQEDIRWLDPDHLMHKM